MYCNAMDTHACFSNNLRGTFKTRLNYFIQELSCMKYAPELQIMNYVTWWQTHLLMAAE